MRAEEIVNKIITNDMIKQIPKRKGKDTSKYGTKLMI
jgi:hypothetical protein